MRGGGTTLPLHLCSTFVCALNLEVEQEVGVGDPGAVGAQLDCVGRIGLRVNPTTGQVIVRDLLMTGIRGGWRGLTGWESRRSGYSPSGPGRSHTCSWCGREHTWRWRASVRESQRTRASRCWVEHTSKHPPPASPQNTPAIT